MDKHKLSPVAKHVIEKCGGVKAAARLSKRTLATVHRWRHERERGGTGGLIPADAQVVLMAAAIRGEVDLQPADFFDIPTPPREFPHSST